MRKDTLFTRSENYRVWLPGTELFRQNASGGEDLSAHGKQLLANALAQYGESVVASAIVIESYLDLDGKANQLAQSRGRAVLVRQYLQNHFQLNHGNLGAMPLMNIPPSGTSH